MDVLISKPAHSNADLLFSEIVAFSMDLMALDIISAWDPGSNLEVAYFISFFATPKVTRS